MLELAPKALVSFSESKGGHLFCFSNFSSLASTCLRNSVCQSQESITKHHIDKERPHLHLLSTPIYIIMLLLFCSTVCKCMLKVNANEIIPYQYGVNMTLILFQVNPNCNIK